MKRGYEYKTITATVFKMDVPFDRWSQQTKSWEDTLIYIFNIYLVVFCMLIVKYS